MEALTSSKTKEKDLRRILPSPPTFCQSIVCLTQASSNSLFRSSSLGRARIQLGILIATERDSMTKRKPARNLWIALKASRDSSQERRRQNHTIFNWSLTRIIVCLVTRWRAIPWQFIGMEPWSGQASHRFRCFVPWMSSDFRWTSRSASWTGKRCREILECGRIWSVLIWQTAWKTPIGSWRTLRPSLEMRLGND